MASLLAGLHGSLTCRFCAGLCTGHRCIEGGLTRAQGSQRGFVLGIDGGELGGGSLDGGKLRLAVRQPHFGNGDPGSGGDQ